MKNLKLNQSSTRPYWVRDETTVIGNKCVYLIESNSKGADRTADAQAGLHLDVRKHPGFLESRPNLHRDCPGFHVERSCTFE